MKTKTFYIASHEGKVPSIHETLEGTLKDAQNALTSDAYDEGNYVILEPITMVSKKTTVTVDFEPTRKRPRKKTEAKP